MATYGTFADGVSLKAAEANDFFKWTSFTPVVKQSNTVSTSGVSLGKYAKVNKLVVVYIDLRIISSGSSNQPIEVDLPVAASSSSIRVIGTARFFDLSVGNLFLAVPVLNGVNTLRFLSNTSTSLTTFVGLTNGPALTLASGDTIFMRLMYETA